MATLILWLGLAVMVLLGLIGQGGALYLSARICRIDRVSYRRALGVVALLIPINLLAAAVMASLPSSSLDGPVPILLLCLASIGIELDLLHRFLRTGWGRAAGTLILFTVFSLAVALSIRAWAIEGFVIPTGAMAPTFYGQHLDADCPHCGYGFAIDYRRERRREVETACPFCQEKVVSSRLAQAARGDRILVEKFSKPKRWDIVVFRSPRAIDVKYVKRLVGLPGEKIEIAKGDLFANGSRLRKHPGTVEDLWLPVHDSRHVPRQSSSQTLGWMKLNSKDRWSPVDAGWIFEGTETSSEQQIQFQGHITDSLPYNSSLLHLKQRPPAVGDVRLTCYLEQFTGDGTIQLNWSFETNSVSAIMTPQGDVSLAINGALSRSIVTTADLADSRVSLIIRDSFAYLMINEELMTEASISSPTLADVKDSAGRTTNDRGPKADAQGCSLHVSATRCHIVLSRITIDRDVYYHTTDPQGSPISNVLTLGPDEYYVLGDNSVASLDSRFWNRVDPRLRNQLPDLQTGPVHRSLLIGVARWRYWPPKRWHVLR